MKKKEFLKHLQFLFTNKFFGLGNSITDFNKFSKDYNLPQLCKLTASLLWMREMPETESSKFLREELTSLWYHGNFTWAKEN